MKRRNIRIVRYADDILVFAYTPRQARKYRDIATEMLENDLKLAVNREKTQLTNDRKGVAYLGFIIRNKAVSIHPESIKKFKDKIRELTPRNHGKNLTTIIEELNPVIRGWANHFRIANCRGIFKELMEWIRRRLRMKKMREWKSWKQLHKALRRRGYQGEFKKISIYRWRNSNSPLVNMALPNKWFDEIGLVNLTKYNVGIFSHFLV